jgi:hypothetical protein
MAVAKACQIPASATEYHYNNTKASCDTKTYMTLSYISKPTKDEFDKTTH